jgi:hypothetical protein
MSEAWCHEKRPTIQSLVDSKEYKKPIEEQHIVFKCRIRAAMRRSKREDGEVDRTADLFDEAADKINSLEEDIIIETAGDDY